MKRLFNLCFNRREMQLANKLEKTVLLLQNSPAKYPHSRNLVESLQTSHFLLEKYLTQRQQEPLEIIAPPAVHDHSSPIEHSSIEEPTVTAQKMMRLFDFLWTFKCNNSSLSTQGVADFIDQLGAILTEENISLIQDAGMLDTSRHRVSGTQPTDDQQQHHRIAETVRVGYQIQTRILRPQEVIIWVK